MAGAAGTAARVGRWRLSRGGVVVRDGRRCRYCCAGWPLALRDFLLF